MDLDADGCKLAMNKLHVSNHQKNEILEQAWAKGAKQNYFLNEMWQKGGGYAWDILTWWDEWHSELPVWWKLFHVVLQ